MESRRLGLGTCVALMSHESKPDIAETPAGTSREVVCGKPAEKRNRTEKEKRVMKKISTVAIAIVGLTLGSYAFAAQNSATGSGTANARIITAISIVPGTALNFGDIVASGAVGTVSVDAAGVRTSAGGATLGNPTGVAAGAFTVNGQANATYAITLPANGVVTVVSGANSMAVNTFVSNPSGTGTLSAGGSQALAVGATLSVGINQAAGSYTGTYNVTVAYN